MIHHDEHLSIYQGDWVEVLRTLPDESVHCVVTSPPYWGLRDYSVGGQLGLEPTPDAYVAAMVAGFREVRRVLRADGTLWLNLGDSYAAARAGHSHTPHNGTVPASRRGVDAYGDYTTARSTGKRGGSRDALNIGLKHKDLVGIPWRVAFALQADGWYLRSDIIWSKPNPMPESVTDRPTKAHEYVFLLTKSARYFYDSDAVREEPDERRNGRPHNRVRNVGGRTDGLTRGFGGDGFHVPAAGRNLRSVWQIDYNTDEEVEWTYRLGSCRRCGGLRVAGNGSAPMTSKATDGSKPPTVNAPTNSAPTESPTSSLWVPSDQDSPSTTFVGTEDASTPPISSPSRSATTSSEATHQQPATSPRPLASTVTTTPPRTLSDVLGVDATAANVCVCDPDASALRSVWDLATEPYKGAHFATFPQKLVEPCIKAGTSERGVCPECGAPWVREVDKSRTFESGSGRAGNLPVGKNGHGLQGGGATVDVRRGPVLHTETTGWWATCVHGKLLPPIDPVPATVLDPFAGSGTTGLVANRLGRRAILIDLSTDYLDQALTRNQQKPLGLLG